MSEESPYCVRREEDDLRLTLKKNTIENCVFLWSDSASGRMGATVVLLLLM